MNLLTWTLASAAALLLSVNSGEAAQNAEKKSPVAHASAENSQISRWAARAFQSQKDSSGAAEPCFLANQIPFSFTYGGVSSNELLTSWPRKCESVETPDQTEYKIQWQDPKTNLLVDVELISYKKYPAVDWVIYFENKGIQDTPILEDVQALDEMLNSGGGIGYINTIHGDDYGIAGEESFAPYERPLYKGMTASYGPDGGRPSSHGFPFLDYQYGEDGVILAIGWTGQWAASLDHMNSNELTHVKAGMEKTHLLLHPGERIRTPRILLYNWKGDRTEALNGFRKLMLDKYSPQVNGKPIQMPIPLQTFDRYRFSPGWSTEKKQIEAIKAAHEIGCDSYWLDASWYAGGFPNGAGNWFADTQSFPNGMKPLSDACHQLGMKFILWFDPERVAAGTQIDTEHPDWVLKLPQGWGLYDLSNPEARRWLTELLSKRIGEYGIDIYRNDFNVSPLEYWRKKDTPDRQGMTEIQYVTGLYEMWDELRSRHPGLQIDNCASGGRRIDIETSKRSMPLWQSDSSCWECPREWNQIQNFGLSQYVPIHCASTWKLDADTVRSAASAGMVCEIGYLDSDFDRNIAKQAIQEVKENSKFWYGNLYPLTSATIARNLFFAYQLDRPDLNEGIILAFRRSECKTGGIVASLHGIHADRTYLLEYSDHTRSKITKKISGKDLINPGLTVQVPEKDTCLLIHYKMQ